MRSPKQPESTNHSQSTHTAEESTRTSRSYRPTRSEVLAVLASGIVGAGVSGIVALYQKAETANYISYDNSSAGAARAKAACKQSYPNAPIINTDTLIDRSVNTVVVEASDPGDSPAV